MDSTVAFPNVSYRTTPLGVGMATLMREPSPAEQQRLLHAAHEAGFRHFDVAPSYGLGAAERVLGRFLRTRPAGVTIGTKVGIVARGNAGIMRLVQRPARALIRRFPALRGGAAQAIGTVVHAAPDFSPATRTRSLEGSLRALGAESLDLLLLHEASATDLADGTVIEWLQSLKQRGLVRNIGIAASPSPAATILARYAGVFDVVQTPSHVLAPAGEVLGAAPARLRVTHSALAVPLARAQQRVAADRGWLQALSRAADADIEAPGALAELILATALDENRGGIVLLGASRADHLRRAPLAVGAFREDRLRAVAHFMRMTLADA